MNFTYEKEFWYLSAFINNTKINIDQKALEIKDIIEKKLKNLTEDDLSHISWNPEIMKKVVELGKNITINGEWVNVIEDFPYYEEDINLQFNTLGYFRFEVEYFKTIEKNTVTIKTKNAKKKTSKKKTTKKKSTIKEQTKKSNIKPNYLQQLPLLAKKALELFSKQYVNQYIFLDLESPLYVFVISKEFSSNTKWNDESIIKHKKELGNWTEIYSGQWGDYSDNLYDSRIIGNLSNRMSELHFIKRNSGFIYMDENNYKMHFKRYMVNSVLEPTAVMRAIAFTMLSINGSLDVMFRLQHSKSFDNLEIISTKIKNLKYLRGMIQIQMSLIYDELDYNRRQHYTSVLTHLLREFKLNEMIERTSKKFDLIYDSMQILYQEKNSENAKKQQRGMQFLQMFFGLSIVVHLFNAMEAFGKAVQAGDTSSAIFKIILILIIYAMFGITIIYFIRQKIAKKKISIIKAVDAVILDGNGNVVLISRKYAPFRGQRALPGGMVEKGETNEIAIIREVREETNLDVKIVGFIGTYAEENRDPRGKVVSNAYLCKVIGDISEMKSSDDAAGIELAPLESLVGIDLAFDHENILQDAVNLDIDENLDEEN